MLAKTECVLATSIALSASSTVAQGDSPISVFFGFDFVLAPLSIKWACGEDHERDLLRLKALMAAFPEDAERAELQHHIDAMLELPQAASSVSDLIGRQITPQQTAQLCNAARPLNIEWLDANALESGDGEQPPKQRAAWEAFFRLVEMF